jgi:beta-lactamase regulating signal transducer with metallopeptidase domain
MDSFNSLFDSQFIYALGWTIVHSFWQSLLVFTLLSVSLLLSKRSRPETRYGLSIVALVCCLLISVKTFVYCYQDVSQASQLFTQLQTTLDTSQIQNWWVATFTTINPWLDTIVLFWCVGFIIQALRYSYDIWLTQKLKKQSVSRLPNVWNERLQGLVLKLGITQSVTFMHSTKINVPSVIGHFKPVILLPLGILTQLPQAHVEAIVLHELAHVRRHDYLINIVLYLIKVLFFFNPFVLAISKKISIEREKICDDIAVKACGDPLTFANSLSQFADVTPVSQSAMAASKDKYLLLDRVKRLFPNRGKLSTTTERLIALICAGILGLTLNVNAKNQPAPVVFETTPRQSEPVSVVAEQNSSPSADLQSPEPVNKVTKSNITTDLATIESGDKDDTVIAKGSSNNTVVAIKPSQQPAQTIETQTEKALSSASVSEKSKQETTQKSLDSPLLARNNSTDASSAARNYLEFVNEKVQKAQTELKQSKETTQKPQQLARRVYTSTDKFNSFSLESSHALDDIDQIIFTPISTSDTEFSVGARKWRNVVSQYFSEMQNQPPRVVTFNSKDQATADFTGMDTSLIAQIRIKDVKLVGAARKGIRTNINSTWRSSKSGNSRTMATKWRDSRRVDNANKTQRSTPGLSNTLGLSDINININSPIQNLETTKALHSKADLAKVKFALEVVAEVVFVDATTYEYVGSGLKKIWLDSANVEPDLLTLARHEGSPTNSRTQTERNADIIKNMWDIIIESIQNDVHQVASAIKNQQINLSSSSPILEAQSINNAFKNNNLPPQHYTVANSEFGQFIVSAPDSLDNFKSTTYIPIVIDDVQLKSKHSGWKEHAVNSLTHIAGQTGLTYDLGNNELSSSLQVSTGGEENLLVQIEVKSLDFYSRSANRTYRNASKHSSGSNYNRGAVATGIGLSPSKDDVGGATVRKRTLVMPSAFGTSLYLRGQFEITLLDPLSYQVLGYATSETTIKPSHSAYRELAKQIIGQNLGVHQEDILLLALFEKVKTQLHQELMRIQQGEMSVKPIQLTTEQANSLTENPLVRTQAGPESTVAKLIN